MLHHTALSFVRGHKTEEGSRVSEGSCNKSQLTGSASSTGFVFLKGKGRHVILPSFSPSPKYLLNVFYMSDTMVDDRVTRKSP